MLKRLSLPLQLVIIIGAVALFGTYINESIVRACYTFSYAFKEVLGFFLPFIIFSFVATALLALERNAPIILGLLIAFIFTSNGLVSLLSYGVVRAVLPLITCDIPLKALNGATTITPFYTLSLPQIIRSEFALLLSIALGLFLTFVRLPAVEQKLFSFKEWIEYILVGWFIPLLPIYVLGFLLKIRFEGTFIALFQHYSGAFILILSVQLFYLLWIYFLSSGFSFSETIRTIKNALPSYVTAFSTMSSTATIPVTIAAAEKNFDNKPIAQLATPIMANVHLLGDCISTPILALVSASIFLKCLPPFGNYMLFALYFCLNMFAVSGIPGGGIIVMIPILKTYLGFTPEMISVITTLYFLFDPFSTAANVMGDGALMILVNRCLKKLRVI